MSGRYSPTVEPLCSLQGHFNQIRALSVGIMIHETRAQSFTGRRKTLTSVDLMRKKRVVLLDHDDDKAKKKYSQIWAIISFWKLSTKIPYMFRKQMWPSWPNSKDFFTKESLNEHCEIRLGLLYVHIWDLGRSHTRYCNISFLGWKNTASTHGYKKTAMKWQADRYIINVLVDWGRQRKEAQFSYL